jgi:hypothetical protein
MDCSWQSFAKPRSEITRLQYHMVTKGHLSVIISSHLRKKNSRDTRAYTRRGRQTLRESSPMSCGQHNLESKAWGSWPTEQTDLIVLEHEQHTHVKVLQRDWAREQHREQEEVEVIQFGWAALGHLWSTESMYTWIGNTKKDGIRHGGHGYSALNTPRRVTAKTSGANTKRVGSDTVVLPDFIPFTPLFP